MHVLRLVAALVLAALFVPGPAHAAAPHQRRVVVLPLGSLGVGEDVASSLLGFLRAEVAKLPGISLLDLSRAGRTLPGAECKGEERCLAAAGGRLGADEVVTGTVAGVGEAYSIDLKRILVRGAREDSRITELISGEREVLIDGVRGAAYKLLLPSQYAGTIQVEVAEAGAEVFVDGRPVGKTPLKAPIPNLLPGKHALKIVKAGFADFDKWVDVRFARVSVLKVDLKNSAITGVMFEQEANVRVAEGGEATPAHGPPPPPPSMLTGQRVGALVLGVFGHGLAGGGVGFALESSAQAQAAKDLQAAAEKATGSKTGGVLAADASEARGRLQAMKANSIAADVFWVAGGVAVAAGVVLWFTGGPASVTPVVVAGPGGATVGLSGTF